MSAFFGLLTNGISCIGYGFLITIAIIAILYLAVSYFKKGTLMSIPFIISLVILFVVLFINMSVMVGAIKIKGIANRSLDVIEQFTGILNTSNITNIGQLIQDGDYLGALQKVGQASDGVDVNNLQELKNQLGDNWDLLKHYFDSADMSMSMLILSPTRTIEKFNSKMNSIIIGNILWSILFLSISIFFGMKDSNKPGKYSNKRVKYSSQYSHHDDDF